MFMKFVESACLSVKDCTENLCWVLEAKASEYVTMLLDRNSEMEFFYIMSKMERRFGFKELPDTSQARLRNAKQYPDKKLMDWADRVLTLATSAYKHLSEDFMHQQAVLTICKGAYDKESGQHASNLRLTTIGDVIDTMRWFQHNRKAIYETDKYRNQSLGKQKKNRPVWTGPITVNREMLEPPPSNNTRGVSPNRLLSARQIS